MSVNTIQCIKLLQQLCGGFWSDPFNTRNIIGTVTNQSEIIYNLSRRNTELAGYPLSIEYFRRIKTGLQNAYSIRN